MYMLTYEKNIAKTQHVNQLNEYKANEKLKTECLMNSAAIITKIF